MCSCFLVDDSHAFYRVITSVAAKIMLYNLQEVEESGLSRLTNTGVRSAKSCQISEVHYRYKRLPLVINYGFILIDCYVIHLQQTWVSGYVKSKVKLVQM